MSGRLKLRLDCGSLIPVSGSWESISTGKNDGGKIFLGSKEKEMKKGKLQAQKKKQTKWFKVQIDGYISRLLEEGVLKCNEEGRGVKTRFRSYEIQGTHYLLS